MSSDLFLLDESFIRHSTDLDMQFLSADHLFPFEDPQSDILQAISNDSNLQIFHSDPSTGFDPFSSSPPSQDFDNLSLSPTTKSISTNGITTEHFSVLDDMGVKSEECYAGFSSYSYNPSLIHSHSYVTEKLMQRSLSSQSLDRKPRFQIQPCFNSLMQNPSFESPEESELMGTMRRVCSAGDIQRIKRAENSSSSPFAAENSSSSLVAESSFMEEGSIKVRRYNAEERKQRINRYRSKRTQRNFNKTIKYACRKTLADSRHRVRGRFARNDETGDTPKVTGFNREEEDEEELWFDGLCEEEEEQVARRAGLLNNSSPTQFQYYSY